MGQMFELKEVVEMVSTNFDIRMQRSTVLVRSMGG